MLRNLDGYYFRAKRDGKWCDICFTDLTEIEAIKIIKDKTDEWLNSLYKGLVEVENNIFDSLLDNEKDEVNKLFILETPIDTPYTKVMKARYNILSMAEKFDIVSVNCYVE